MIKARKFYEKQFTLKDENWIGKWGTELKKMVKKKVGKNSI